MAVAFVRSHTVTSEKVSDNSVNLAISTETTPGNVLVAYILYDNAATAGQPSITGIARASGETNTWMELNVAATSSTSAGAFANGALYAIRTSVVWPVGTYAITFSTAVTQKATLVQEFSGALRVLRSGSGTAYSTTTTAASATTTGTAPVVGDLALGFIFGSNVAVAQAGDTDTVGGAWSTPTGVGSTGGSGATNNFGIAVYKAGLTATTHQTLNNSAAMTAGNGAIVAILQQYVDPSITQAAYRFYADGAEAASGGPVLLDGYDETNRVTGLALTNSRFAQSFLGTGKPLARASFHLIKPGTPDGTITAALYAHTGTFGTGLPTGTALATSSTVINSTSVTSTAAWYDFDFDGTVTLTNGTPYFIAVTSTNTVGAGSLQVSIDNSSPAHAGSAAYYSGTTWTYDSTFDFIFKVFALAPPGAALAAQDAAPTVDVSAGDVDLQVRVRLQSTTAVAVDATDDFQLQWERNASGTWWPLGIGGAPEQLASSYDVTPNTNVGTSGVQNNMLEGQTFMGSGGILSRCEWKMIRTGSPTGTIVSKLYPHTLGTFGTDGEPGDAQPILATSTTIKNHADIQTVDTWESFVFDPVYVLQSGTPYTLAWHPDTTYGVASTHTVRTSCVSGGTAPGNRVNSTTTGASWTPYSTYDTLYRVYELPPGAPAMPYNSASLTDDTATTNRLTGGSGTFTAGKVAEDGLADNIGWAGNNYTELLYSLTLKQADLANGDMIRFRILRNGATTGLTYYQVPTVAITKAAGVKPKADTLTDTFDTQIDSKWVQVGTTGLSAGVVSATELALAYSGLYSAGLYTLMDSWFFAKVTPPTVMALTSEAGISASDTADWNGLYAIIRWNGTKRTLLLRHRQNQVNDDTTIDYDPVAMAYLDVEIASGNAIWQTSPNGVNNWTMRRTRATTLSLTEVQLWLYAGQYGAESTKDTAYFDNVNVAPQSFSDDFNRANAGDLGANWGAAYDQYSVTSNRCAPEGSAGSPPDVEWTTPAATSDNFSQITVTTASPSVSSGVLCRCNDPFSTTDYYLWRANGGTLTLFKVVGGAFTAITADLPYTLVSGDVLKISAVGSTITGYVNGVATSTVTDTAITTGGYVGIRSGVGSVLDDWYGGDGTGPAGQTLTYAKTDNIGITDTQTDGITINRSDNIGITDAQTDVITLNRSDSLGITDAQTDGITLARSDNLGATDAGFTYVKTGLPKIATLTEDFTSLAAWTGYNGAVASGGQLVCAYTDPVYVGSFVNAFYDLHESSVFAQITAPPPATYRETAMTLFNGTDTTNGIWVIITSTDIGLRVKTNNVNVDTWTPYSTTAHAWARVRLAGTTAYLDAAPDGATWTQLGSVPCTVDMSHTRVEFSVGQYTGTGSGTAYFDNVNIAGVAGQALTYGKTDNLGITDAQTDGITLNRSDNVGLTDSMVPVLTPAGKPKIDTIIDDFSSGSVLDSVRWPEIWVPTPTIENGQAKITYNNQWPGFGSQVLSFSFVDSSVFAKVTPVSGHEMYMQLKFVADSEANMIEFWRKTANTLFTRIKVAGIVTFTQSTTYSAVDDAWWKITSSGTTVTWFTSPDGLVWNQKAQTSTALDMTSGHLFFYAGATTAGTAYVDNVNVPPVAGQALTLDKTDNLGLTDSMVPAVARAYAKTDNLGLTDSVSVVQKVKAHTITDTFSAPSTNPPWNAATAGTTFTGGQMRLAPPQGVTTFASYRYTASRVDFTDSSLIFEVVDAGNQSLPSWRCLLGAAVNLTETTGVYWVIENNTLKWFGNAAGLISGPAYSPTDHRWLRFRETSGTYYLDTSPNGVAWNNIFSAATSTLGFPINDCYLRFEAGTASVEASASACLIDNLNTAPVGQTLTLDKTDNMGVTDTQTDVITLARSDNLGLTDSMVPVSAGQAITLNRTDNAGLTDVAVAVPGAAGQTLTLNRTDNLGLTDLVLPVPVRPGTGTGKPKAYVGGSWQSKPAKVYIAGAWVEKPVRRWDGSAWVKIK